MKLGTVIIQYILIILVLVSTLTVHGIATVARQRLFQHVRTLMHTIEGCRSIRMYKSQVFLASTSEWSEWQIYCIYRTCVRACVSLSVCSGLVNQTCYCVKCQNLQNVWSHAL